MAISITPVDPWQERDAIIDFFWEQRHWPWKTRDDYCRNWDWRYSGLGDGETIVWLARDDDGSIVGHIALHERRFRSGGRELKIGVPGNLLVRRDYRDKLVGPRLATLLRTSVRSGRFDAVIAYANRGAHHMFERLGFTVLGGMGNYSRVLHWRSKLGRRNRMASPVGRLLDAWRIVRRSASRSDPGMRDLAARHIPDDALTAIDCSHWAVDDTVIAALQNGDFIRRRFVDCPIRTHEVYGIFDATTHLLEGFVVLQGAPYAKVWCCQVNRGRLREADAIELVSRALPHADTLIVPLLPDSPVADALAGFGFSKRRRADHVEGNTWWSAYWLPNHPLAETMADPRAWRLWIGSSHH